MRPRPITRALAQERPFVGDGWHTLVTHCFDICDATGLSYEVDDIKEKFGGLRFYVTFLGTEDYTPEQQEARERAEKAINFQEGLSYQTCEECGQPGTTSSGTAGRWLKTLCEADRATRDARLLAQWSKPTP